MQIMLKKILLISTRTTWFTEESRKGCIKTRLTPASFLTVTVKWAILYNIVAENNTLKENLFMFPVTL